MTKPKCWRLVRETGGNIYLVGGDGEPIRKPNATNSLGYIMSVTIPSDSEIEKFRNKAEKTDVIHVSANETFTC